MKSLTLAALTMGCTLSIVTATNAFATVETFNWALTGGSPSLGYAPVDIFSFFGQGSVPSGNSYGEETSIGFGVGTFAMSAVATTSSVPEPSTWAMMTLGFAGLGLLAYRRVKAPVAA
jgi:PEP-CTERM motif